VIDAEGNRMAEDKEPQTITASATRPFAVYVICAGLVAVVLSFGFAVWTFRGAATVSNAASGIAAVLSPITAVIGSIVAGYFGVQLGQVGTAEAQQQASHAQQQANVAHTRETAALGQVNQLAGLLPPDAAAPIVGIPSEAVNAVQSSSGAEPRPAATGDPGDMSRSLTLGG